ncbi:MAG: AAA family ATPase [Sulfuricella sp.]
MSITFTRATRAQVPLKLGITGPSGSGKTTAALKIARGLVGPSASIAFLDTENGSASLYADITEFDVLNMNPPYKVEKFTEAITAAAQIGSKALIIDSASHEWIQILQDKEAMDARGGNQWTNWASFTKKHEDFLAAIRNASIHLILCLRSKEKHEMNDAKKVVKLGMGSQTRDGFEYELTTVFDLAMDHTYRVGKDRTRLFDGRLEQVTENTGRELAAWLSSGKLLAENTGETFTAAPPVLPAPTPAPAAKAQPRPTPAPVPSASKPSPATGATRNTAPSAGSQTSSAEGTTEPTPEWVAAMTDLCEVTIGMPDATRRKLIAGFEADGPAALEALRAEVQKIRSVLNPDSSAAPTAGAVIAALPPLAKQPVSQAASDFVDGIDPTGLTPDTDEANGGISADQYEALNKLVKVYGLNRDALRAYMAKSGHLLPGAHGPTLARMKAEEFVKLRDKLYKKDIAANNETWSARTIRIINATPIPSTKTPGATDVPL